jgi:hypothetical protein
MWQEGFCESVDSRFKDGFLHTELCRTVAEDQAMADHWYWEYSSIWSSRAHTPAGSSTSCCRTTHAPCA